MSKNKVSLIILNKIYVSNYIVKKSLKIWKSSPLNFLSSTLSISAEKNSLKRLVIKNLNQNQKKVQNTIFSRKKQ